jgi:hypothetical protein
VGETQTISGNGVDLDSLEPIEVEPERVRDMAIDVKWKAQHITRLHLCEPTGAQFEKALVEIARGDDPHSIQRFKITLIAQVAKVPREVVEAMPISQIEEAADFLAPLLPGGRRTGAT